MPGANQAKVSAVKGDNLDDMQALGDGHDRYVSRIKPSILVKPDKFRHAPHVLWPEVDQLKLVEHEVKEMCVYGGDPYCLLMTPPASISTVEG